MYQREAEMTGMGMTPNPNKAATPEQPQAAQHAQRLHDLASKMTEANARLAAFISRMVGPEPASAGSTEKEPEPQGVLYVAAFGAERISREIGVLHDAISRLDRIA